MMSMIQFYRELLMPAGKYSLKRYIALKFASIWVILKALSLFPGWEKALTDNTSIAIIGVVTAATAATIQLTKSTSSNDNNNTNTD